MKITSLTPSRNLNKQLIRFKFPLNKLYVKKIVINKKGYKNMLILVLLLLLIPHKQKKLMLTQMKCSSTKILPFSLTYRTRNIYLKPPLTSFVKYYSNMKHIFNLNNIGPHLLPSKPKLSLSKQEIQSSLFILQLNSQKCEQKKFIPLIPRQYSMKTPKTRIVSAMNNNNNNKSDIIDEHHMKQFILIAKKTKKNVNTSTLNGFVSINSIETPFKVLRKGNSERGFKINKRESAMKETVKGITSARVAQTKKIDVDDNNYISNNNSNNNSHSNIYNSQNNSNIHNNSSNIHNNSQSVNNSCVQKTNGTNGQNSSRKIGKIFIKAENKKRIKNGDIAGHFLTRDFIQESLVPKK